MSDKSSRKVHDSMGELAVPVAALWGAQTQRAIQNFQLSGLRMPAAFIQSLGLIKWAAARANGELQVIDSDKASGHFTFCDCAAESPIGRRSACYDADARESRKENRPENSAVEMASAMGIDLLTEEQYRALQTLGEFDVKTSSWIKTPPDVRALGGALFCDRRYGKVFVYHNGAQSYYAARGFRGLLRV